MWKNWYRWKVSDPVTCCICAAFTQSSEIWIFTMIKWWLRRGEHREGISLSGQPCTKQRRSYGWGLKEVIPMKRQIVESSDHRCLGNSLKMLIFERHVCLVTALQSLHLEAFSRVGEGRQPEITGMSLLLSTGLVSQSFTIHSPGKALRRGDEETRLRVGSRRIRSRGASCLPLKKGTNLSGSTSVLISD